MSKINVTQDAKMYIWCIFKLLEKDGLLDDENNFYPKFLVIDTIRGIKSDEIIENGCDKLNFFGWGEKKSTAYLEEINELLIWKTFIEIDRHKIRFTDLGYKWHKHKDLNEELFLSKSTVAKRKTINVEQDVKEYFVEQYENESYERTRKNSPYEQQHNEGSNETL